MLNTKNVQNVAYFQYNDLILDYWYDQQIETNDNESIDFNYSLGRSIFAKSIVDWLNETLSTNLQFIEVKQPKEYNFDSNKIVLSYSDNDIVNIKHYMNDEYLSNQLDSYLKDVTTHKNGYIAFYTLDQIKNNTDLLIGCILQVIHDTLNNDFSLDDFETYYNTQYVYDKLLECIVYNDEGV